MKKGGNQSGCLKRNIQASDAIKQRISLHEQAHLMIRNSVKVMTTTPAVKETLSSSLTCGVSFM